MENIDCVFCKIITKDLPADIILENEKIIIIKTIKPMAPIHLLAIPKKHISSFNDITLEDKEIMVDLIIAIQNATCQMGLDKSGYKITINVGKGGEQEIFHLHFHILGGWKE